MCSLVGLLFRDASNLVTYTPLVHDYNRVYHHIGVHRNVADVWSQI